MPVSEPMFPVLIDWGFECVVFSFYLQTEIDMITLCEMNKRKDGNLHHEREFGHHPLLKSTQGNNSHEKVKVKKSKSYIWAEFQWVILLALPMIMMVMMMVMH